MVPLYHHHIKMLQRHILNTLKPQKHPRVILVLFCLKYLTFLYLLAIFLFSLAFSSSLASITKISNFRFLNTFLS